MRSRCQNEVRCATDVLEEISGREREEAGQPLDQDSSITPVKEREGRKVAQEEPQTGMHF